MDENVKTKILNDAGLNWNVEKTGIQTVGGIVIPDRMALVREDTQTVLGIHSEGYEPYQNDELLELVYRLGNDSGLKVHGGGSFKGGQKVWFQLKSNDLKLGNDKIKGYISGFNSFDGSTSLAFGNATTTISCMNTFFRGYREVSNRLIHSGLMRAKIDEILVKIDLLLKEEKGMFKEIKNLANFRMTPEIQEMITKKLFNLSVEERLDDPELSQRKKNMVDRFNSDLKIEIADKEDTLWGLFSGVTRYTTHSMRKDDNSESKMFGYAGRIERQIYSDLVEMV